MAIKVVPNQKNSKFLHFLNAYICLDLGQEESQKAWKILVIKFLALLRPVVLTSQLTIVIRLKDYLKVNKEIENKRASLNSKFIRIYVTLLGFE